MPIVILKLGCLSDVPLKVSGVTCYLQEVKIGCVDDLFYAGLNQEPNGFVSFSLFAWQKNSIGSDFAS